MHFKEWYARTDNKSKSHLWGFIFLVSGGTCSTRKLKKYMINTNYNYPTMHNKHKLCLPCSLAYYETFHYNQLERFTHLLLWQWRGKPLVPYFYKIFSSKSLDKKAIMRYRWWCNNLYLFNHLNWTVLIWLILLCFMIMILQVDC